jgi:outer membrane murein-binding lipoprotein Lpp
MAPWWLRQLAVFGSISPSTASGKVFFIRDIGEWNSITIPATLDHLLGMGIGPLLATRIGGLVAALMIYGTLVGGFVLVPFMVIGGWARRRSLDFGPFFLYAGLLFAFSTVVSAIHVPGGTFIHSAVALAPHSYVLALEGIAVAVSWVAARRTTWDAPTATRAFTGAVVVFAAGAAVVGSAFVHGVWSDSRAKFQQVATALQTAGAPATDRVMSIDAAGTKYWTGHGGVVLVNDPPETIRDVIEAYDIRWLVLDREDSVKPMAPVLDGPPRPTWLGDPILSIGRPPGLAVFPVEGAS